MMTKFSYFVSHLNLLFVFFKEILSVYFFLLPHHPLPLILLSACLKIKKADETF